jgi:hypothetical protein
MAVHQRHAFAETRGFRRRGDAGGTAPHHNQVVSFQIVRHYLTIEHMNRLSEPILGFSICRNCLAVVFALSTSEKSVAAEAGSKRLDL